MLKTEGNLNNEVGVPLTLLRLSPEHRAAAVEMGMNHLGEIARLAAIAQPGVGIVLNVRGVHLEHLKTIENVAKAKGELYFGLPEDGVAVANADDPLVMEQARASGRRIVTFGQTGDVRSSLGPRLAGSPVSSSNAPSVGGPGRPNSPCSASTTGSTPAPRWRRPWLPASPSRPRWPRCPTPAPGRIGWR